MKLLKSKLFWLSVGLIGSLMFYINLGTPWQAYQSSQEFESYLEDKYQKDFQVTKLSYDPIHHTYHANAYAESDPELVFYIGENMGDKVITDSYDFENLRVEATEDISEILEQHMPAYTDVNVDVISTEGNRMEINVWADNPVEEDVAEAVTKEIEESGYSTNQIFFNTTHD